METLGFLTPGEALLEEGGRGWNMVTPPYFASYARFPDFFDSTENILKHSWFLEASALTIKILESFLLIFSFLPLLSPPKKRTKKLCRYYLVRTEQMAR